MKIKIFINEIFTFKILSNKIDQLASKLIEQQQLYDKKIEDNSLKILENIRYWFFVNLLCFKIKYCDQITS